MLRADAPEFVPTSWTAVYNMSQHFPAAEEEQDFSEVSISEEELAELEEVEQWVEQLVDMELAQEEHLKAVALSEAPPEVVLVVEERALHLQDRKAKA